MNARRFRNPPGGHSEPAWGPQGASWGSWGALATVRQGTGRRRLRAERGRRRMTRQNRGEQLLRPFAEVAPESPQIFLRKAVSNAVLTAIESVEGTNSLQDGGLPVPLRLVGARPHAHEKIKRPSRIHSRPIEVFFLFLLLFSWRGQARIYKSKL